LFDKRINKCIDPDDPHHLEKKISFSQKNYQKEYLKKNISLKKKKYLAQKKIYCDIHPNFLFY
jgi:hypothetical protein